MFMTDTGGYDMILGMTWLCKYHAVIDCRNKSVIFRIPHLSEFQFVGESKASRPKQQGDYTTTETQKKLIPVVEELLDVSGGPTRTSARSKLGVRYRGHPGHCPNL